MRDLKERKFVFSTLVIIVAVCVTFGIYYMYKVPSYRSYKVFGVTYMTMNNPFYEVINNEMLKSVESQGDELITLDAVLDVDKQISQIRYLINQRVDGIFVNPIDSKQIEPALIEAHEAGIPVIVLDAPIENETLVVSTVVSDNYDAGVQCARDMMKHKDKANIILLKHSAVGSAKDRMDGFLDTIKDHEHYKVINEGECEGQLELAMPKMLEMLEKTPDVDVVMALNDPSALGALAALEINKVEDVLVYGVDGTPDLKSLINHDPMIAGTVAQSPIQIGQMAVKLMNDYLAGKEVSKEMIIPVKLISPATISYYDEKGWQ